MTRGVATAALLFSLAACTSEQAATVTAPVVKPRIGYGDMNHWHVHAPEPTAHALDTAGLGLTGIEWAPAGDTLLDPVCDDGSSSETYPERAALYVEAMRERGIETLIVVRNANGCAQRRRGTGYVVHEVDTIRDVIGTEGVIVEVVAEPWADHDPRDAESQTRLGAQHWPGALVLPDLRQHRESGLPYYRRLPFALLDVHYCNDEHLLRDLAQPLPNILHNTDCGLIVNPGPERAAHFAAVAKGSGAALLVYDFKGLDFETIAAMGAAIH